MPRRALPLGLILGAALSTATLFATPPPARLQGQLRLDAAPPIDWTVHVAPAADTRPIGLDATARAEGLDLRIIISPDAATGQLRWRITTGVIEPAVWWPVIRARAGLDTTLAGWGVGGRLTLAGEGLWHDNRPAGSVTLAWDDGVAFNDELGVEAGGITARLHTGDLAAFSLPPGQRLSVAQIIVPKLAVTDLVAGFSRSADGVVSLAALSADLLGGRVLLGQPLDIDPASPRINAALRFTDLSVGSLAALAPTVIERSDGRLSGRATVDWRLGTALPDSVRLTINHPEDTRLHLAAQPGLLSSGISPRLALLPLRWKPLARLFSPANPVYVSLSEIETGHTALAIESMRITLGPGGADGAAIASIHLKTRPLMPGPIKSLTLDININTTEDETDAPASPR